jgi:phospholipid/cholesterol/gamma-HCH transport system substrate-binding protein
MRYKFNPYERAVGFFLTFTFFGSISVGIGIAVKKNWFEEKTHYVTYTDSAANIRVGSSVLIAGLKVGKIEEVELEPNHKVRVSFNVLKKYSQNLTEGSKAHFVRPFVIGDKVLTVIEGELDADIIPPGSVIPLADGTDILELLTGKNVEVMMAKIDSILSNLNDTLVVGKDLALQVGDKKKLQKTMENVAFASGEIKKALPHFVARSPQLAQSIDHTMENLALITKGLKDLQPVLDEVARKLPEGSDRTIALLNESVTILQAMQKSFLLKGSVAEVKREQSAQEKGEVKRLPASE